MGPALLQQSVATQSRPAVRVWRQVQALLEQGQQRLPTPMGVWAAECARVVDRRPVPARLRAARRVQAAAAEPVWAPGAALRAPDGETEGALERAQARVRAPERQSGPEQAAAPLQFWLVLARAAAVPAR